MSKYLFLLVLTLCCTDSVFSLECYTTMPPGSIMSYIIQETPNQRYALEDCVSKANEVFRLMRIPGGRIPPESIFGCYTALFRMDGANYAVKGCMTNNVCEPLKTALREKLINEGFSGRFEHVTCTFCKTNRCNRRNSSSGVTDGYRRKAVGRGRPRMTGGQRTNSPGMTEGQRTSRTRTQ